MNGNYVALEQPVYYTNARQIPNSSNRVGASYDIDYTYFNYTKEQVPFSSFGCDSFKVDETFRSAAELTKRHYSIPFFIVLGTQFLVVTLSTFFAVLLMTLPWFIILSHYTAGVVLGVIGLIIGLILIFIFSIGVPIICWFIMKVVRDSSQTHVTKFLQHENTAYFNQRGLELVFFFKAYWAWTVNSNYSKWSLQYRPCIQVREVPVVSQSVSNFDNSNLFSTVPTTFYTAPSTTSNVPLI